MLVKNSIIGGNKMKSDFVKLAATLGGIFLLIVIVVLIFAKEMLVFVLTNTVWAFVVLGIVLGAYMSKAKKKE